MRRSASSAPAAAASSATASSAYESSNDTGNPPLVLPAPTRLGCEPLPLTNGGGVPTDYDYEPTNEEQLSDAGYSVVQRVQAELRDDPKQYNVSEADDDVDAMQMDPASQGESDEESESDENAPPGGECFEQLLTHAAPLLEEWIPAPIALMVLDYLAFDMPELLEEVRGTRLQLLELIHIHRKDCDAAELEWPANISDGTEKNTSAFDPVESLSPSARVAIKYLEDGLLQFDVKLDAPFAFGDFKCWNLATPAFTRARLVSIRDTLAAELDAWEECFEEADEEREVIEEEIRFAEAVRDMCDEVIAMDSSQIFIDEDGCYAIAELNRSKVQEGESGSDEVLSESGMAADDDKMEIDDEVDTGRPHRNTQAAASASAPKASRMRRRKEASTPAAASSSSASAAASSSSASAAAAAAAAASTSSISQRSWGEVTSQMALAPAHYRKRLKRTEPMDRRLTVAYDAEHEYNESDWTEDSDTRCEIGSSVRAYMVEKSDLIPADPDSHAKFGENSDQDENMEWLSAGPKDVLRRRMTPSKHAAATALVAHSECLRAELADNDFASRGIEELRAASERLRVATANYYLLHMSRSSDSDEHLRSWNGTLAIQLEQSCTDLVFNKSSFERLVHEVVEEMDSAVRFTSDALEAVQTAAEDHVVRTFRSANRASIHALDNYGRAIKKNWDMALKVKPHDMQCVRELSG